MRKKMTSLLLGLILSASMASNSFAAAYTVNSDDVLWKIADRYSLTVSELKSLNNLSSDEIFPGQSLIVSKDNNQYTVKANDTMWIISQRLGIKTQILIDANPQISNPNSLIIGQTIYIPSSSSNSNSNSNNQVESGKKSIFADGMFPLKAGTYESYVNSYGDGRNYNPSGTGTRSHEGIDIMANKGTAIYSALNGKVVKYGWSQYGGWMLAIQVDDSTIFYYAHMSGYANGMGIGAEVKRGQIIGYVGSTGYGPKGTSGKFENHLHFGIYTLPNWSSIDPYPYLKNWE
ncbi:LysM peptidoglycan-binding domain-containing protein [Chengkuizengella sp. SCS-71B]|uniref:M23 family metallopeptidase n=1 Tax=Chengkuizengella sp. SCS-71B TaxID=3115290 RepID=UPI0032C23695